MKTFKDLKVTDVLYIIRDDGYSFVCRAVNIITIYTRTKVYTRVYYDYANKYTENYTLKHFDVDMTMCDDEPCLLCEQSGYYTFTVHLNRELALKDLDERIEFLTRQKKNL